MEDASAVSEGSPPATVAESYDHAIEDLKTMSLKACGSDDGRHDGPDDLTCPICLEQVDPVDMATIKGCEHLYCVHCILQWSLCTDVSRCPQCKSPFTYVFCHRLLDGTVVDFPVEETITLLKRAKWFEERVKKSEHGESLWREAERRGTTTSDWHSEFYDDFEDLEQDEDDEIEKFYFSSAAGRARVFGNRRLGENGFLRSGRQYARPLPAAAPPPANVGKGKGKAAGGARGGGGGGSSRSGGRGGAVAAAPDGSSGSGSGGASRTAAVEVSGSGQQTGPGLAKSSSGNAWCGGGGGAGVPRAHAEAGGSGSGHGCNPVCSPGATSSEVPERVDGSSSSSAGPRSVGRRAQRKARRMAVDEDDYDCDDYGY